MLVNTRCRSVLMLTLAVALLTAVGFAGLPTAQALEPGEVSYYAEVAAGFRAIAAQDPDEKIRNPDTLAIKVWSATDELFYAQASVSALILLLVAAVPMYFLVIRNREFVA